MRFVRLANKTASKGLSVPTDLPETRARLSSKRSFTFTGQEHKNHGSLSQLDHRPPYLPTRYPGRSVGGQVLIA